MNSYFKIAQEVEQRVRKVGRCLTAVNEQDYNEKEACCAQEREVVDDFLVASTFDVIEEISLGACQTLDGWSATSKTWPLTIIACGCMSSVCWDFVHSIWTRFKALRVEEIYVRCGSSVTSITLGRNVFIAQFTWEYADEIDFHALSDSIDTISVISLGINLERFGKNILLRISHYGDPPLNFFGSNGLFGQGICKDDYISITIHGTADFRLVDTCEASTIYSSRNFDGFGNIDYDLHVLLIVEWREGKGVISCFVPLKVIRAYTCGSDVYTTKEFVLGIEVIRKRLDGVSLGCSQWVYNTSVDRSQGVGTCDIGESNVNFVSGWDLRYC